MNFPENLKYTKEHEWLLVEGNFGKIGITEYAQSELGDVVFVDIDPNISEIKRGEAFGTIEAVKTVSDIYAPVNGKVIELNKTLSESPELINSDPYGAGWMARIELANPEEVSNLLDSNAYKSLVGQ